jgi:hypothetical protein
MKKVIKQLVLGTATLNLCDLLPPVDIMIGAACNATNAELFFSDVPAEMAQAREICMSCPVRQMCLDYYTVIENEGIAGGLTAAERRKASANAAVYSLDDVNDALDIQRDIASLSATAFSKRYDITERTYYRWKLALDGQEMAS